MIFMGLLSSIMRMNPAGEYKPFLEGNATLDSVYAYTFGSQFPGEEDTLNENKIDKTGEKLDTL